MATSHASPSSGKSTQHSVAGHGNTAAEHEQDAGAGGGMEQKAALRFLSGAGPLSTPALVGLHKALMDGKLVTEVVKASRKGAKLAAGLKTEGRSIKDVVKDPAFQWKAPGDKEEHGDGEHGGAGDGEGHAGNGVTGTGSALGGFITVVKEISAALDHPDGMISTVVPAQNGVPALPVGTFVHVIGFNMSGQLKVHAYSGIDKDAIIPRASFHPEPGLVHNKNAAGNDTGPRDDVYQEYTGPLWDKDIGPQPSDAYVQGALSDCYFMASMAAVCGANPDAIKRLFDPKTPSKTYRVTLYKKKSDGSMTAQSYTVDNILPTQRGTDHNQAYANTNSSPSRKNADAAAGRGPQQGAMWVSLLEKAWAIHKGSYQAAAFGYGADGMEALTGVPSRTEDTTGSDGHGGGLIQKFRDFQAQNQAVAVGTKEDPAEATVGWTAGKFAQSGNTFVGQLDASLVFQRVWVADVTSAKKFQCKDDSNNNMIKSTGDAILVSGSVDYQLGKVTLVFDSAAKPDNANNIQATWSHCGPDFQKYGLCGRHEYHFVRVQEPDKIVLKNPWGYQDPKPVDAPGMAKCFSEIASNAVPGAATRNMGDFPLPQRNSRMA